MATELERIGSMGIFIYIIFLPSLLFENLAISSNSFEEYFFKKLSSSLKIPIERRTLDLKFLKKYALKLLEEIARFSKSKDGKNIIYIKIPIEPVLSSSLAIRRRIISSAMERILGHLEDISFKNISDVLSLLRTESGGESKWLQPIRSLRILRINGFIHMIDLGHIKELPQEIKSYTFNGPRKGTGLRILKSADQEIKIDGETDLKQFSMNLRSGLISTDQKTDYKKAGDNQAFIDYDKVELPVKVRSWEEGDRFYPLGAGGSKKLQDFFTDSKITVNKRANIPVFYDKEKIIWVGNQRIDHRVRITRNTKKILQMELFEK